MGDTMSISILFKTFLYQNNKYYQTLLNNIKPKSFILKNYIKLYFSIQSYFNSIEPWNFDFKKKSRMQGTVEYNIEKQFPELKQLYEQFKKYIRQINSELQLKQCYIDALWPTTNSRPMDYFEQLRLAEKLCNKCLARNKQCLYENGQVKYDEPEFIEFVQLVLDFLRKHH